MRNLRYTWMILACMLWACAPAWRPSLPVQQQRNGQRDSPEGAASPAQPVRTGAESMERYMPLIEGKSLALVVNHTSLVDGVHLLDTLLSQGIHVSGILRVFVPEHGFRGDLDAGAEVESATDPATGIQVVSLYGAHRKPLPGDLEGVDLVLYDIQDVG
ncbi:MAG TPA: DUF1343 domain-containing protein, partial [Bacteroides sp.]|nr:DUF1343 domain-containing protein [Bacteroides sp.]